IRAFAADDGLPAGQVYLRRQDEGGRMWAYTTRGFLLLQNERWAPPPATIPVPQHFLRETMSVRENRLRVFERGRFVDYLSRRGSSWQGATLLLQDREGATWVALGEGPALHLLGGQVSLAGP